MSQVLRVSKPIRCAICPENASGVFYLWMSDGEVRPMVLCAGCGLYEAAHRWARWKTEVYLEVIRLVATVKSGNDFHEEPEPTVLHADLSMLPTGHMGGQIRYELSAGEIVGLEVTAGNVEAHKPTMEERQQLAQLAIRRIASRKRVVRRRPAV